MDSTISEIKNKNGDRISLDVNGDIFFEGCYDLIRKPNGRPAKKPITEHIEKDIRIKRSDIRSVAKNEMSEKIMIKLIIWAILLVVSFFVYFLGWFIGLDNLPERGIMHYVLCVLCISVTLIQTYFIFKFKGAKQVWFVIITCISVVLCYLSAIQDVVVFTLSETSGFYSTSEHWLILDIMPFMHSMDCWHDGIFHFIKSFYEISKYEVFDLAYILYSVTSNFMFFFIFSAVIYFIQLKKKKHNTITVNTGYADFIFCTDGAGKYEINSFIKNYYASGGKQ